MKIKPTSIKDLILINPKVHTDERGYFCEQFNKFNLKEYADIDFNIAQINHSYSYSGVLRGIHYQKYPNCQKKLIIVMRGTIYDVAVDLRKDSKTYKKYFGEILSETNNLQMYIPEGFGHAFLTLSKEAHIVYAVDKPYSPKDEITLRYDDNLLNINWKEIHKKYIPNVKIKTSKKDSNPLEFKNF
tara:strand:- start:30856 stop:31413 length:558 start_codon:yes stop_codon:yes gene_type:complete